MPRLTARLMCAAVWLAAWHAAAVTYYVAPNGKDVLSPGTADNPLLTIQRAVNLMKAGDTVIVRAGVYAERVTLKKSGTEGSPIVIRSETPGGAIIEGAGLDIGKWGGLVTIDGAEYLTLSGFEIRDSPAWNIFVTGEAAHLRLENLNVHDAGSTQVIVSGPREVPAFSVISGCTIHDGAAGGICLYHTTGGYWRIENNEVYGNKGAQNYDGIQVGSEDAGSHHIVIKNNRLHDNATGADGADNLDLGGHDVSHHFFVEGNDVYGGGGHFKLHSGSGYTPGVSSFHIARFNRFTRIGYDCYKFPDPVAIYNNTFVDAGQAVQFFGQDGIPLQNIGDTTFSGGDAGRMNWKNNILFQESPSAAYALICNGRQGATIDVSYKSVRFQHTLYKFSAGQRIAWGTDSFGPMDETAFAAFQGSHGPDFPDTGSILTSAPASETFADYAGRDYRLLKGCPAVDAGMPLTKAANSGTHSTTLTVDRASYFHDGYPINGEYLNTPDSIVIGKNPPIAIVSVDDANNTITLKSAATWAAGDDVTLPYKGSAPDIGAFEFDPSSQDVSKPVIVLNGDPAVTVEARSAYSDAGARATDNLDGDITDRIVVVNGVNTRTVGDYVVTYNVTDSAGNAATPVKRSVKVADSHPPLIVVNDP